MIDFACKRFVIDDIVKCAFGLTRSEFEVFKLLADSPEEEFVSSLIAKKLSLDISTVQRALKKLYDQDVLFRGQSNFTGGGYEYSYTLKNTDYVRKKIHSILKNWLNRVDDELTTWL